MASQTHDAAGQAAEAGNAGLPQLDFSTFGNQIFWLLVALAAIYFILNRIALPRIAAVLTERQGTISNDLAAAEELKQRAQEAEAAYDKALSDARAEAAKIVEASKAAFQAELDAAMAKADAEIATKTAASEERIAQIQASALESVRLVAHDTAKELTVALGHDPDDAAIEKALAARMKG